MQKVSIRGKKQKGKHTRCCRFESFWNYEFHQERRLAVALNYVLPVAWNEPFALFYLGEKKKSESKLVDEEEDRVRFKSRVEEECETPEKEQTVDDCRIQEVRNPCRASHRTVYGIRPSAPNRRRHTDRMSTSVTAVHTAVC